jgi:hypothetical protein
MDKSIYLAYMYSFYIVFENSITYKLVEQLLSLFFWKGFSFEQELYFEVEGKNKLQIFFVGPSTKFSLYYYSI